MARLDHEHVVPVYEAAEDPTARVAYLVMPFLRGEPLDVRLTRDGQLPTAEAIRIAREAAEGLQAAHDRGLIHRDVKPSNIWLDRRGKVKLLDFGLAHVGDADVELSQEGRVVGTPAYMAPEQANGQPVDARADLFSLGCVLYRMATGKSPFGGPTSIATLYSITTVPPPDPQSINPALPAELADLIRRLLARDPADRPASAGAVARELADLERREADTTVPLAAALPEITPTDPWSEIHPPDSRPPTESAPAPTTRWSARRSMALAAAALLVIAVTAAVLLLRPARGTVIVEPADPAAEVRLGVARIHLADDDGRMYTLEPGERSRSVPPGVYRVMIVGGERLDPDPARVEVRRGERSAVRIVVVPNMVRPRKLPPVDPERTAAEWVRGLGGTLGLSLPGGKSREVGPKDGLPAGPFTIRNVRMSLAKDVPGQLHHLAALKDLQALELTDCRVGDADLADIGAIPALKALAVSVTAEPGRVTDAGLVHLSRLTRLERLILAGQLVSDAGLAHLADLTALQVVGLSGTRVTGIGLAHLAKSVGLKELHGLGAPTDAGVASLTRFPDLSFVDLGHALNVTDAGLKQLAGLARLDRLNVHNSRLTDDGLKALTGLTALRGLGADGTALTDEGLAHLKAFPKLESLGVGATAITDRGLKTLGEVKTIRWLNVRQTKSTPDGVKALQQALPACEIHSDQGVIRPPSPTP
jgi:hypothetical protein